MNIDQKTLTEQYDEVDRRYLEALYAIHHSQRSAETRLELLKQLQDGHSRAATATAQLEIIRAVMKELRG